MAHHAAKLPACANCHYAFPEGPPDAYCPRCGQQNQAPDLRLGHVLEEALEGFFHFDGKVWQTLRLLLFRPGELTRRFLAGQRVGYVPPIRLYVFISFVFFFVLSLTLGHEESAKPERKSYAGGLVKVNKKARAARDSAELAKDVPVGAFRDSVAKTLRDPAERNKIKFHFVGLEFTGAEMARLPRRVNDAQVDSILRAKKMPLTFRNRFVVKRIVRWHDASSEEIWHQVLRSGSILLFFLMPLAALLLKLFYIRRSRYYLSHLIFTIHVHCFIFVVLLLTQLLDLALPNLDFGGWVFLLLFAYFVLAVRRNYAQGWGKTIAKSLLLGLNYILLFAFSFVLTAVLGAAIF